MNITIFGCGAYSLAMAKRMAKNEESDIKTTISMEVLANKTQKMEDGNIDIQSFEFVGLCLLGEDVKPRNSRCWIKSSKI